MPLTVCIFVPAGFDFICCYWWGLKSYLLLNTFSCIYTFQASVLSSTLHSRLFEEVLLTLWMKLKVWMSCVKTLSSQMALYLSSRANAFSCKDIILYRLYRLLLPLKLIYCKDIQNQLMEMITDWTKGSPTETGVNKLQLQTTLASLCENGFPGSTVGGQCLNVLLCCSFCLHHSAVCLRAEDDLFAHSLI